MRTCLAETGPICRACGRPVCDHPDPVFAGVLPDPGDKESRDSKPDFLRGFMKRVVVHGASL